MTTHINSTTALTAVNIKTNPVSINNGDFRFRLSATFEGTVTLLRKASKVNELQRNSGTHTAADGQAAMTDSTLVGVVADELIGMWIRNNTDNSMGPITDNTATVITATLAGGTQNDWDTGEAWDLWDVIGEYTDAQHLLVEEVEDVGEYIAVMSAYTSGTARATISK